MHLYVSGVPGASTGTLHKPNLSLFMINSFNILFNKFNVLTLIQSVLIIEEGNRLSLNPQKYVSCRFSSTDWDQKCDANLFTVIMVVITLEV